METTAHPTCPGWEHRLQAVLALLGGTPVPQVTAEFGLCRSVGFFAQPPKYAVHCIFGDELNRSLRSLVKPCPPPLSLNR
jgi:hypothetical protein